MTAPFTDAQLARFRAHATDGDDEMADLLNRLDAAEAVCRWAVKWPGECPADHEDVIEALQAWREAKG